MVSMRGIDSTCSSYHEVCVLGVTLRGVPLAKELIFESENEVGDFLMDRKGNSAPRPKKSPKCKCAGSKC